MDQRWAWYELKTATNPILGTWVPKINNKWNHTRYKQTTHNTDCSKRNCQVSKRPVYDLCQGLSAWICTPRWGPVETSERGHKREGVSIFSGRKRWVFRFWEGFLTQEGFSLGGEGWEGKWQLYSKDPMAWAAKPSPKMFQELGRAGNTWGPACMSSSLPKGCRLPEENDQQDKEGCDSSPRLSPPSPLPSANSHRNQGLHEHILDFLRAVLEPEGGIFLVSFRWRSLIFQDKGGQATHMLMKNRNCIYYCYFLRYMWKTLEWRLLTRERTLKHGWKDILLARKWHSEEDFMWNLGREESSLGKT